MGHARLSPSGSSRWMLCPASVNATAHLPDKDSAASKLGTGAHYLLETAVRMEQRPTNFVHQVLTTPEGESVECTPETCEAVAVCYDFIMARRQAAYDAGYPIVDIYTELEVFPARLERFDCYGTSDIVMVVWADADRQNLVYTEVLDYKHGSGVYVDVQNNRQAQIYGIGTLDTLGLPANAPLVTTICQPRMPSDEGVTRSQTYEPIQVVEFTREIKDAAALTDDPNAPFNPGEYQCKFCKLKGTCTALANHSLEAAQAVFSDISETHSTQIQQNVLRDPKELSLDQIRMVLENKDLISSWLKACEEFAFNTMINGDDFPGFKLVPGRRSKKWKLKEEELVNLIHAMKKKDRKRVNLDEIYSKKLNTPAGMEKALKPLVSEQNWAKIKEQIEMVDGSPQIAPATSDKPAINVKASDVFEPVATAQQEVPDFLL